MKKNEVKYGAILSYILIILNSMYGLLVVPYVLSKIGPSEFGVYKTIASLSGSLAVLDLGFGSTVLRYIAKFNAKKEYETVNNYLGMMKVQVSIMAGVLLIVALIVFPQITRLYSNQFSAHELFRAKELYLFLIVNMVLSFYENMLFGVITGFNRFTFANLTKLILLLSRIIGVVICINIFKNSLVLVISQVIMTILALLIHYIYIKLKLKVKFKLTKWDNKLFFSSFKYTMLMFLQSLVVQFNGNVDNMVIGAVKGPELVTVYSFAITIFNMYETLSTAISGVMLPTVTNKLQNNATNREMENLTIDVGRVQYLLLGSILAGFVFCGKTFFKLWLGEGFEDCYYLGLILMIPVTIPLIQNVCLSILRAKNLMGFRTISLCYATAINCIITIWGTIKYGYYFAAIGTCASTIIGSIISINIYYKKKLGLNVIRILFGIMHKITFALVISVVLSILTRNFIYPKLISSFAFYINKTWIYLIFEGMTFMIFYVISLLIIYKGNIKNVLGRGLNVEE